MQPHRHREPKTTSHSTTMEIAMAKRPYDAAQLKQLLLQMMETELGGELVYRTALEAACNDDLKKEWEEYLEETRKHQEVVRSVCEALDMDPDEQSPARMVVKSIGESLVKAMELARKTCDAKTAEIMACECVVHAETKDQANWELLGKIAEAAGGKQQEILQQAYDSVWKDEQHHLFHTKGWCRELAIEHLGMPSVLPPPEEAKQVETAIGAARAEQQRSKML